MRDADRKVASAIVVAAWTIAGCAIASAAISPGHKKVAAAPQADELVTADAVRQAADVLERESQCLAQAIYYEARSETEAGQLAVAQVVLNRVNSPSYPKSICGVVFQGSERSTGCQFSFTCDGSLKASVEPIAWSKAERLAEALVLGHRNDTLVGSSTHYHADYVAPVWGEQLHKTKQIGRHIFYSDRKSSGRG